MAAKDMKAAWAAVGDELSSLGLKLKLHAEQEFADTDDDEVSSLLDRLAERLDDAVEAIGNAGRDEAVRDDLRELRSELVEAMSATVTRVRDEFRSRTGS